MLVPLKDIFGRLAIQTQTDICRVERLCPTLSSSQGVDVSSASFWDNKSDETKVEATLAIGDLDDEIVAIKTKTICAFLFDEAARSKPMRD